MENNNFWKLFIFGKIIALDLFMHLEIMGKVRHKPWAKSNEMENKFIIEIIVKLKVGLNKPIKWVKLGKFREIPGVNGEKTQNQYIRDDKCDIEGKKGNCKWYKAKELKI